MKKFHLILLIVLGLLALGCEKTIDQNPGNPYLNQSGEDTSGISLGLKSIEGLHQNVFAVRCANPTCHDGSFEPDFRTVQSTYSSLVYHPVTKNDAQGSYEYRVHPGKASRSWIIHRLSTDDEILGRMPLYAQPLKEEEIQAIRDWINDGARDMFGQPASLPNLPPVVHGYQVHDSSGLRADTNRVGNWATAMKLAANASYLFYFQVSDDTTATADLQNQKIEFSLYRDNFQPFASVTPAMIWNEITVATVNTDIFSKGKTVYFRYYVEDEEGEATQFPSDESEFWYKENFSFIVQ